MAGVGSDDDAVAVVDLVLDDLRRPPGEGGVTLEHTTVLILHFNAPVTQRTAFALERQAALRGVERAIRGGDPRVEHRDDAPAHLLVHERDDRLGLADHVRRHADAAAAVGLQRVAQVVGDGQVVGGRRLGRPSQERKRRHDGTLHGNSFTGTMMPVGRGRR